MVSSVSRGSNLAKGTMRLKLLSTDHWQMEEDGQARVMWLRRSDVPFRSIEEVTSEADEILKLLATYHRLWGLVTDLRRAPSRNDPAFEDATRRLRTTLIASFARTAIILASPAGMLQLNRVKRDDGCQFLATLSEEQALRFARGQQIRKLGTP